MMMIYANILVKLLDSIQTTLVVCSDKDQLSPEWYELSDYIIFIFRKVIDSSKARRYV